MLIRRTPSKPLNLERFWWIITLEPFTEMKINAPHYFPVELFINKWTRRVALTFASSETQGQRVGARESLNGRENMARRKVKNGEKSPWGQCLTRPVPNGRRRSAFWLGRKTQKFSGTNQKPERRRPFGTGLVRHCPQVLFSPFFTFLRAIFFRPFRLSLAPTICPWVSEDVTFETVDKILTFDLQIP